ncbi:hypothetical protein [Streptomyces tateyamensis]|uniref:hypothetical protein n=1 Tax=Streptomyces tateyamensis TaxID=565073 RepID=UPI002482F6E1|nr:hypothetical protein [Streptomyces tateyamensis]
MRARSAGPRPDDRTAATRAGERDADVKAKALAVSRRRVFLGHHTKFGASSFCRFAEVADFEAIVTDTGLPVAEAHRYAMLGPQVIRA